MSIFSLFTSRKPDVSKYAFVDTEVGTKDHKIHDIGALRYDEATYHGTSKEELERFLVEGKVASLLIFYLSKISTTGTVFSIS